MWKIKCFKYGTYNGISDLPLPLCHPHLRLLQLPLDSLLNCLNYGNQTLHRFLLKQCHHYQSYHSHWLMKSIQSFHIQIDSTHIADCSTLSRYHNTCDCLEIIILHNLYKKKHSLQSAYSVLAFKRPLFLLILHKQKPRKVCETKGVKYFTFRNKTLNANEWRLRQVVFWSRCPIFA